MLRRPNLRGRNGCFAVGLLFPGHLHDDLDPALFGNRRWQNLAHCGSQSVFIGGERIQRRFVRGIWLVLQIQMMRPRRMPWNAARRRGKQPGGFGQGLVVTLPIVETIANMSYRKFVSWL